MLGLTRQLPAWFADGMTMSGRDLEVVGVQLAALVPESALLFRLTSA